MQLERGRLVGDRFEVERLAGAGSMAIVYRARDRRSGLPVALKVLESAREQSLLRFEREAKVLAALRSPGVVRYVGHGRLDDHRAYLVTEWLEGEDLHERLERGSLSVGDALLLGQNVASALAAAHARGVVHRDLKPANLFLVDGGVDRVKVLDFGVAQLVGEAAMTATGLLIGTPAYMAPEQARGESGVDGRADIFALGVILHEALAGAHPFASPTVMAVLAKVLFDEVTPLAVRRPDVPPALSELVSRMLAKDPAGRPRDGAEIALALAGIEPAEPILAPDDEEEPSITGIEQRLVCVVLAAPVVAGGGPPASTTPPAVPDPEALAAATRKLGVALTPLVDGSIAATVATDGQALVDAAVVAARAALAVRSAAPGLGAAVATGRAVAGERAPIGALIDHAASLLRSEATAVGVVVDDATASLLETGFELVALAPGSALLLGERVEAAPARTLLGRTTPCVGRRRELAILEATYDECVETPRGVAVLVSGEAGIGKSRLRDELLTRLAAHPSPPAIWVGRGDPVSAGSPFGLLSRALKEAAGLLDGEPIGARRSKIRRFVDRLLGGPDALRVTEFLAELCGAPFDGASVALAAARRDPRLMGDQMQRAFTELVTARCDAGPVLLVLEDVHWGDLPSIAFLASALREIGERPFFLLALGRPEVDALFPELCADLGATRLALRGLSRSSAAELVRSALGESAPADRVEWILDHAQGNAFFLEELIREEAAGRSGAVPETVLGVVEARLTALDAETRRILRAASVFGRSFPANAVAALCGGPDALTQVLEALVRLEAEELVQSRLSRRFTGQLEYAFRHEIVREAAYAMLTAEDRALGHRLAARWLAAAGETEALVLAEHHERAGEPDRAAPLYATAARHALDGDDLRAAIARAERGVECGAAGELLGELRLLQANAHRWSGEPVPCGERAGEALRLLPRGGAAWYRAAGEWAHARGRTGNAAALGAFIEELLALEPAPADRAEAVTAFVLTARIMFQFGSGPAAAPLLQRAAALGGAAAGADPIMRAALAEARSVSVVGDPAAYAHATREAAQLHEQVGNRRRAITERVNAGYGLLQLGAYEQAEAQLRAVHETAERMHLQYMASAALCQLGHAVGRQGRLDEARAIELRCIAEFEAQGDPRYQGYAHLYLADALLQAGEIDRARSEAGRAEGVWRKTPPLLPHALALVARIELRRGDLPAALAAAEEGFAAMTGAGVVLEGGNEGPVRLAYVEALAASGRAEAAREHLRAARVSVEERAGRIGDPALRKSFLTRIPENARILALAADWGV